MARTNQLLLRVREADEADYGKSVVRIHEADKPRDIQWGDNINISLDKKHWVSCRLEPAGDIGTDKIYIGIHLRGLLNKDTVGLQIAQLEQPCNFYIRDASPPRLLISLMIGVIVVTVLAFLVYSLGFKG